MSKPQTPPKTEGQRLLRALPGTAKALGARLNPPQSPPAMTFFRYGSRVPKPETRREMERVLGIPFAAWDQLPGGAPLPAPTPPEPAPAPVPTPAPPEPAQAPADGRAAPRTVALPPEPLDVAEGNTDLLSAAEKVVRQALNLMQTAQLTPSEARAAQERALKGLETLQRLRHQEEVRESVLAKHPVFTRMMGLILDQITDTDTLTRIHAKLTEWRG